MDEIKKNDYMNGGGWSGLFSRENKTTADMVSNEMEELLSNEIEQLKRYIVVPGYLNSFFKKMLVKEKTIFERVASYKIISSKIDVKITSKDTKLPDIIEIPRKLYKKDKSNLKIEIESVKISKKELLMHLANFKIDLDEFNEKIIKNLDKLKDKMLGNKLINLNNFKFFMLNINNVLDCNKVHEKIEFIKKEGIDAFKQNKAIFETSSENMMITGEDKSLDTSLISKCKICNIIISNMNNIDSFIINIIDDVKAQLLDSNKNVKNFFYDYLMDKIQNKSSSFISFMKSSYKKLLIHFYYNLFKIYKSTSLDISEDSYKIENNNILAMCTIYVNGIYDYLNQSEYLNKVLSLMNPNNYQTFCFKTVFNLFINIETKFYKPISYKTAEGAIEEKTVPDLLSKLFIFNTLTNMHGVFVTSSTKNYDFIDTIYINGSTNYIDSFNEQLIQSRDPVKNKLSQINYSYNNIIESLYSKLQYYDSKNNINSPIYLTESLFLLVDIVLTLYNIKTREIIKDKIDEQTMKKLLECNIIDNTISAPVAPKVFPKTLLKAIQPTVNLQDLLNQLNKMKRA
jgi:hypothetical protein